MMKEMENVTKWSAEWTDYAWQFVSTYGLKLVGAIVALVIGLWLIKWLLRLVDGAFTKAKVDESLRPFLRSLTGTLFKVMLAISIMTMLGINMTSFIAILGAAGLAVGMALSGTLQNFAGGVMILLFKPFKVGDFIEAQGFAGVVKEIQIFVTIMTTPDNKTIIIPNAGLANGSLINYSTQPTRRVDWTFGIGYGDDLEKAKKLILDTLAQDERVLKDPAPTVALAEMADSAVNLGARAWVKGEDYWGVYFDTNEKIYNLFNAEGINIPYPQMDVHVHNN